MKCDKCYHDMWYAPYLYDQGKIMKRWLCMDCGNNKSE